MKFDLHAGLGKLAELTNFSFILDILNIVVIVLLVVFVLKGNVGGARDKVVTATESLVDSARMPTNRIRARYLLEEETLVPFAPEADVEGEDTKEIAKYGNEKFDIIGDDDMDREGKIIAMEEKAERRGFDMDFFEIRPYADEE